MLLVPGLDEGMAVAGGSEVVTVVTIGVEEVAEVVVVIGTGDVIKAGWIMNWTQAQETGK